VRGIEEKRERERRERERNFKRKMKGSFLL